VPSTVISFEWSNGGRVRPDAAAGGQQRSDVGTRAPIHRRMIAVFGGNTTSTVTPRNAARGSPVMSRSSGRKYGVMIRTADPRARHRLENHEFDLLEILIGTRSHDSPRTCPRLQPDVIPETTARPRAAPRS